MFVLASHFGPSEKAIWIAVLAIVAPAAFVGFFARSPWRGFKLGGLTSGGLTFLWLGVASNKMMGFAAVFTPVFAIIGALVGCFFGYLSPLRQTPSARMHVENRNPFEPVDPIGDEQRQDHGAADS